MLMFWHAFILFVFKKDLKMLCQSFTLTFPEVLLKEEAVLPAPDLYCPGLHISRAQSSDIAPTYFLLSLPFLKNICTSLLQEHVQ